MTDPYAEEGVRAPEEFRRPWLRSGGPVARGVAQPLEAFLRQEAGSGLLLLLAAAAALLWANLAPGSYAAFWTTEVAVGAGSLELRESLREWVNDLLMALFFYLIALEVKREALHGALRDRRHAAVPVAAALGGIVAPALVYLAVNLDGGRLEGWAVPVATDVAFALAILALLGGLAPGALRAFLLTLAVVDDIVTVLIIALFYTAHLSAAWLAAGAGIVGAILLLRRLSIRILAPYVLLAGALWVAVFESGVHGTIAGVVIGFLTPSKAFHAREATGSAIAEQLQELDEACDAEVGEGAMHQVSRLAEEAVSPLARMEAQLHPWSAYGVLPAFALANAGVAVSLGALAGVISGPVGLGILLGLVVGKPLGVLVASVAAVKLAGARLPEGVDWSALAALGPLAGIGFTVAIFISGLAFLEPALLSEAKVAILLASVGASGLGAAAFLIRDRLRRSWG